MAITQVFKILVSEGLHALFIPDGKPEDVPSAYDACPSLVDQLKLVGVVLGSVLSDKPVHTLNLDHMGFYLCKKDGKCKLYGPRMKASH